MLSPLIETLIKVSQLKNYSQAAEELGLTQPAVSHHIKQLEEEFKVKIFTRVGRSIELTDDGKILLKYALRMRNIYNTLVQAVEDNKKNLKHLKIGITPSAENGIISKLLAKYSLEKENMHITIVSDTIKNIYDRLREYELDVAFVDGKILNGSLQYILLDTDNLILAVSNDNPLAKKRIVTLEDLKKEKLIVRSSGSGTGQLFADQLKQNGEKISHFDVILEVDNIAMIKDLVRHNYGVSVLAKSACQRDIEKKHFSALSIENLSMIRELNVVYHKDFEHLEVIDELVKLYHEMR